MYKVTESSELSAPTILTARCERCQTEITDRVVASALKALKIVCLCPVCHAPVVLYESARAA